MRSELVMTRVGVAALVLVAAASASAAPPATSLAPPRPRSTPAPSPSPAAPPAPPPAAAAPTPAPTDDNSSDEADGADPSVPPRVRQLNDVESPALRPRGQLSAPGVAAASAAAQRAGAPPPAHLTSASRPQPVAPRPETPDSAASALR